MTVAPSNSAHHGLLLKLVEADQVGRVTRGFMAAIEGSFIADRSRVTSSEIRRRFELCMAVFVELRGDLKWTLSRILDSMPRYLRVRLDGGKYDPIADSVRGGWSEEKDPLLADRGDSILATPDSLGIIVP